MNADLLHALLNSILGMFYIEAISFGRGLGALDINATNIRSIMILNPEFLTEQAQNEIIHAFIPLKNRNVMGTNDELGQEDRMQFDHTILNAFGIDRYYNEIKEALLSMQQVRHTVRE